jgi:excinuclease ABC subunit C
VFYSHIIKRSLEYKKVMNLNLINKIKNISKNPGIYIFKDENQSVIYVGKAKNLRKRLSSYLNVETSDDLKLKLINKKAKNLHIITTKTEIEALVLEAKYIKKYKPKYNIILKDDKTYPYIKINTKEKWPKLEVVRKVSDDGANYFGPYISSRLLNNMLKVSNKVFLLRKCKNTVFKNAKRPCLHYQINTCLGPCVKKIKQKEYNKQVSMLLSFLKGNTENVIKELKEEMNKASKDYKYEEASVLRDKIKALNYIKENNIFLSIKKDIDVFSEKKFDKETIFILTPIRGGMILKSKFFGFLNLEDKDFNKAFKRSIFSYYTKNKVPDEIYFPFKTNDEALEEYILSKNKKAKILFKRKAYLSTLTSLIEKELKDYVLSKKDTESRWEKITEELNKINKNIQSIECYDISNTSGTSTVGAKVFFNKGLKEKNKYRKYIIREKANSNDLIALKEIFKRRLNDNLTLPDLILVDGGKTQLHTAKNVFKQKTSIASIAKGINGKEDKIYIFKNSEIKKISFSKEVLNFFKRIRDEAHRFVISFHRKKRQDLSLKSLLDDIPGIGKKRKDKILKFIFEYGEEYLKRNSELSSEKLAIPFKYIRRVCDKLMQ